MALASLSGRSLLSLRARISVKEASCGARRRRGTTLRICARRAKADQRKHLSELVANYEFTLPPDLVASRPLAERDASRIVAPGVSHIEAFVTFLITSARAIWLC